MYLKKLEIYQLLSLLIYVESRFTIDEFNTNSLKKFIKAMKKELKTLDEQEL